MCVCSGKLDDNLQEECSLLWFWVAMQSLPLRRTAVGLVFVCAKYKCKRKDPREGLPPGSHPWLSCLQMAVTGSLWVPTCSRCWCLPLPASYSQGGGDDRAFQGLQVVGSFHRGHVLLGDPGALLYWDRWMKRGAGSLARIWESDIYMNLYHLEIYTLGCKWSPSACVLHS